MGYSPWRHRVGHNWVTNTYTLYWSTLKVMQENIIILLEKALCILQHWEGENRAIFIQIFIISDVWYLIWNKNFLLSAFASALRTSFSIFFFYIAGLLATNYFSFPLSLSLNSEEYFGIYKALSWEIFSFQNFKDVVLPQCQGKVWDVVLLVSWINLSTIILFFCKCLTGFTSEAIWPRVFVENFKIIV